MDKHCKCKNCDRPAEARGLCRAHHARWMRNCAAAGEELPVSRWLRTRSATQPIGEAGRRGGWTAGKLRSDASPERAKAIRHRLTSVLDRPDAGQPGLRNGISRRAVAEHCGCADSTVRKFLAGRTVPMSALLDSIETWLDRVELDAR